MNSFVMNGQYFWCSVALKIAEKTSKYRSTIPY